MLGFSKMIYTKYQGIKYPSSDMFIAQVLFTQFEIFINFSSIMVRSA